MGLKIFYATFDLFSDIHFDVNVNEQLKKTQPYNFTSKLTCLMIQFCSNKRKTGRSMG